MDVAIGPPTWADTSPVDAGTIRVASGSLVALHDPDGLLHGLVAALSGPKGSPPG